MRKITIFIVCMLLVGTFFVVAPDTVSADQDGDYTYTVSGGVATITGYTGSGGAIVINSTLGGYPTRYIGANAFDAESSITSVAIPDSVTSIGIEAFNWCRHLTSATIGRNVTIIDLRAFLNCNNLISIILLGNPMPDMCYCWVDGTHPQLTGHVYDDSGFPLPGHLWFNLMMGEYIHEDGTPMFGRPSPTNGSTGNLLSLSSWNIPITDVENFDWTIKCSNGQTSSLTGASNGIKSLTLSGLAYSTVYKVWVNATDPTGSGLYTRRWYTFTTQGSGNNPPVFGTPSPANGSTENLLSLTWNIPINDPEGNTFSWTIKCSNGQVNSGNGASNGTKSLSLSGLAYSTTYTVWVNATDPAGSNQYTRSWFTFTTKASTPPVFGTPSPANGSTENLLSLTWNIPINDSEGDAFSWTIQCSNGQTSDGTSANNGTKSLVLSDLTYLTTYKVWVNTTDPTGSGYYTKKWYTFTTQQQSNVPPDQPKTPTGPASGDAGVSYIYSSNTTDSNGDQVYYLWDWGDGTDSGWVGPYDTGDICQESHIWSTKGGYNIRVKAKDASDAESVWSDPLSIMMPYSFNKPILSFFELLCQRFPNIFPLLRQLIGY
jgi:hypothetical protein